MKTAIIIATQLIFAVALQKLLTRKIQLTWAERARSLFYYNFITFVLINACIPDSRAKLCATQGHGCNQGRGQEATPALATILSPLTTFFAHRRIVSSCGVGVPVSGVTKYGRTYQRCTRYPRCSRSWTSRLRTTQKHSYDSNTGTRKWIIADFLNIAYIVDILNMTSLTSRRYSI